METENSHPKGSGLKTTALWSFPLGDYIMKLVGTLLNIIPGVRNANGRIYPRAVLEKAIADYTEKFISTGRALGELYKENSSNTVNLVEVSHHIDKIEATDAGIYVEAHIVGSPNGQLVESSTNPRNTVFVARALATLDEYNVVQDDLEILAIDIKLESPNV